MILHRGIKTGQTRTTNFSKEKSQAGGYYTITTEIVWHHICYIYIYIYTYSTCPSWCQAPRQNGSLARIEQRCKKRQGWQSRLCFFLHQTVLISMWHHWSHPPCTQLANLDSNLPNSNALVTGCNYYKILYIATGWNKYNTSSFSFQHIPPHQKIERDKLFRVLLSRIYEYRKKLSVN